MAAAQRRVFRIEKHRRNGAAPANGAISAPTVVGATDAQAEIRHRELMAAIRAVHERLEPREEQESISAKILQDYKHDLQEAQKIKDELNRIYEAINRTKQEIATLHKTSCEGLEMHRMTDELSAIVEGTEQATENILNAAEEIDSKATELVAALKQQRNQDHACDIQELVVKIFEACNFQDLTGQRITKVVRAFQFIEERVTRMMEIWGGIESFNDVEVVDPPKREGDAALLNGPALETDEDVASQDDIDALFD
ncbi:MAG: protein phosphatase CheZ [Methyloligellaceae bacterium]